LFEALAAGKPIIASDLGGEMSNIINTEKCGILIKNINPTSIGETLDKIKDSELRKIMEQNSKKAGVQLYNWKLASTKLREEYLKLLQA
jgi:glycosyltransferase involved in cell wall biosynthesis